MHKCGEGSAIVFKPDGIHPLDPCRYVLEEIHTNCIVEVSRCKRCGCVDISWRRTDETEDLYFDDKEEDLHEGYSGET